jgi:microcystin-dependent protein
MSECYIGEIRIWSGVKIPEQWALCNGQAMAIRDYEALYSVIGTTYGGDGVSTFKLPNLQGWLPIGQGQGTGLTMRVIGQTVGAETETLTLAELPAHSHAIQATSVAGTANTPSNTRVLAQTPSNFYGPGTDTTKRVALNDIVVAPNSGVSPNYPHANMMPYTAINYIIALNGFFPVRPS